MLCKRFSHAPNRNSTPCPAPLSRHHTAPMATINFCLQNFRLRWTHASLMPFGTSHSTFYHIQDAGWSGGGGWGGRPPVSIRAIKLIKISVYRVTTTYRGVCHFAFLFFPVFLNNLYINIYIYFFWFMTKYLDNLKALLLLMCPAASATYLECVMRS